MILKYNTAMTALFAQSQPVDASDGRMRPLNILRDLPAVADLIELCFASTLDPAGRSSVEEMRRNGQDSGFLRWAPLVIESVSLPLSGFVWEHGEKIVGNVSLIPFFRNGQKTYFIANVATHPSFRQRGIARALTLAAISRAREKNADSLWLHVRADNPTAIRLYASLGFVEKARRTEWYAAPYGASAWQVDPPYSIEPRPAKDWQKQSQWLEAAYPSSLHWYARSKWNLLAPGVWNWLYRALMDVQLRQWSIYHARRLQGVLSAAYTPGQGEQLWLAVPPQPSEEALTRLLLHARKALAVRHSLTLEFPADRCDSALSAAGFIPQRTLVWMQLQSDKGRI